MTTTDKVAALRDALERAESFIAREGYRRCDVPACNCGSWHPSEGWYARFREIDEAVGDHSGRTLLAEVKRLAALAACQPPAAEPRSAPPAAPASEVAKAWLEKATALSRVDRSDELLVEGYHLMHPETAPSDVARLRASNEQLRRDYQEQSQTLREAVRERDACSQAIETTLVRFADKTKEMGRPEFTDVLAWMRDVVAQRDAAIKRAEAAELPPAPGGGGEGGAS